MLTNEENFIKDTHQENNPLQTKLKEMLETEYETLKREVIEEALECGSDEEIECFFDNLFRYGCVSGMVGKLVWYTQTHAF